MITSIVILLAIFLHLWLGDSRKDHPLTSFAMLANWMEKRLNFPNIKTWQQRVCGVGVLFALLLVTGFVGVSLIHTPTFGIVFEIGIIYLTVGYASLVQHAQGTRLALNSNDIEDARLTASYLISQDTSHLDSEQIAGFTTEAILENGNDAVVATIFWYVIAGVPGALAYRLTHTLDNIWTQRSADQAHFSWAASKFLYLLNWVPERLCGFTYVVIGGGRKGVETWWQNAKQWSLPKGEIPITSGAYALNLQLGGDFIDNGVVRMRPYIGHGASPTSEDIERGLKLVYKTTWSWVALILMGDLLLG